MKLTNEEKSKIQKEVDEKIINLFKNDFKIETNYINKTKVLENNGILKKEKNDKSMYKLIEDRLPYNLDRMEKDNVNFLFTKYNLIGLLQTSKFKQNIDKYKISYLTQINLYIENKTEEEAIKYITDKICIFFKQIKIPILILVNEDKKEYADSSYTMGVKNNRNRFNNIAQLSIISKKYLEDLRVGKGIKEKVIFDISFNEKMYEYYIQFQ